MKGLAALVVSLVLAHPAVAATVAVESLGPGEPCHADAALTARLSTSPVVSVTTLDAAEVRIRLTPGSSEGWLLELINADGSKRLERRLVGAQGCDELVVASELIIERALRELGPAPVAVAPVALPPVEASMQLDSPVPISWGLVGLGVARPTTASFGGALNVRLGLGSRWQVGLLLSLTTSDRATVTIEGLDRGTMAMTPASAWFHGGPCFGGAVRVCPELIAGVRVWHALASGPYLFRSQAKWAANPLTGLSLFGRADLPYHLSIEVGAAGLWSIAPPVFAIGGSPTTTFSAQPLELDVFVGLGCHFD